MSHSPRNATLQRSVFLKMSLLLVTFPILLLGVTALKSKDNICELALQWLQFCIKANPDRSYFPLVYWTDESGNLGPDSPEDQRSLLWEE